MTSHLQQYNSYLVECEVESWPPPHKRRWNVLMMALHSLKSYYKPPGDAPFFDWPAAFITRDNTGTHGLHRTLRWPI